MLNRQRILNDLYKNRRKICLIAAALLLLWLVRGNVSVGVTRYDLYRERVSSDLNGFRIAQISDLHNASFGRNNSSLLKKLKKERPNIIVITGDLIDSNHTDVARAVSFAEKAMEIAPCYYVTGNHEAWVGEPCRELEEGLKACGVEVLHNEMTLYREGRVAVEIYGVDDPSMIYRTLGTGNVADTMQAAMKDLPRESSRFRILLAHRPEAFDVYAEKQLDLVFSGHVHGGQFRLPLVGGLIGPGMELLPEYDGGVYQSGRTAMVVSRGLGSSVIPLRVGNRPELVITTLHTTM